MARLTTLRSTKPPHSIPEIGIQVVAAFDGYQLQEAVEDAEELTGCRDRTCEKLGGNTRHRDSYQYNEYEEDDGPQADWEEINGNGTASQAPAQHVPCRSGNTINQWEQYHAEPESAE